MSGVIILNIDTSGKNCSVCISEDEKILSKEEYLEEGFSHAEKLHLFIKKIVEKTIKDIHKIDAVSVNSGPGSFTGLRIGSSSAKGICFALNKPLVSLNSLEILANGYLIKNHKILKEDIIFPVIDARNENVYKGEYSFDLKEIEEPAFISVKEYNFKEFKKYIFLGDGIDIVRNYYSLNNCKYYDNIRISSSEYMVELSLKKYRNREFENLENFEPNYIKNFIVNKK